MWWMSGRLRETEGIATQGSMTASADPVAHAGNLAADDDVVAQSLVSRRAATHWLFSHLTDVRGVWIPDTAVFDDEGVLVAWLSTQPLQKKKKTEIKLKAKDVRLSDDVEVRSCDFMKLSLLRFEAHLQDLAKRMIPPNICESETVAVLYTEAEALKLDETALDTTIRSLCARERSMTATEPDVSIPRVYPGGCFVVQAAVRASHKLSNAMFQEGHADDEQMVIITRVDARSGSLSHEVQLPPLQQCRQEDIDEDQEVAERRVKAEVALALHVPRIESQCHALLAHLKSTARLRVDAMTLEFVCVTRDCVVLTCVHSAQWFGHRIDSSQRLSSRVQASRRLPKTDSTRANTTRHSAHFRVCRECRAPVEVDLAREVLQSQTLLRGTLAKYQEMSERHADAESRCRHAVNQTLHMYTQIRGLETEVMRLRADLTLQQTKAKEETQQKLSVETQLVLSIEQTERAQQDVAVAHERIQELLQQRSEQFQSFETDAACKIRELETQELTQTRQIQQMQREIKDLEAKNRHLQALYEEAQASSDEMKFQWGFVTRKLTDVGESGVLPPTRVAGGFSSYPTPTPQNVEQVVKWIVNYETKRTVLEAQQQKSVHVKTVRKRLRMKVELMRLLAASTSAATSPGRSPSPSRRRSSRSPRKRQSLNPKKESLTDERPRARWAQEQPTLVEQRMRQAVTAMAKHPMRVIVETEPTHADMQ